jgi:RNA recognition motif-containing protein
MIKSIYAGNLPFSATENEIRELFSPHGNIQSIKLITDRETGKFRGFCFVEMEQNEADAAIEALNETEFNGFTLRVNEAKEKTAGGGGSRGGSRFGGRDSRGGGGRPPRSNSW